MILQITARSLITEKPKWTIYLALNGYINAKIYIPFIYKCFCLPTPTGEMTPGVWGEHMLLVGSFSLLMKHRAISTEEERDAGGMALSAPTQRWHTISWPELVAKLQTTAREAGNADEHRNIQRVLTISARGWGLVRLEAPRDEKLKHYNADNWATSLYTPRKAGRINSAANRSYFSKRGRRTQLGNRGAQLWQPGSSRNSWHPHTHLYIPHGIFCYRTSRQKIEVGIPICFILSSARCTFKGTEIWGLLQQLLIILIHHPSTFVVGTLSHFLKRGTHHLSLVLSSYPASLLA